MMPGIGIFAILMTLSVMWIRMRKHSVFYDLERL